MLAWLFGACTWALGLLMFGVVFPLQFGALYLVEVFARALIRVLTDLGGLTAAERQSEAEMKEAEMLSRRLARCSWQIARALWRHGRK